MTRTRSTTGRSAPPAQKERLTTSRIVDAAVALADREGIESLSMRKLAEDLDAAPMALYKHIAHKDELLDRMVDVVFGEVELPTDVGWRQALRERATSKREALLRHPWAIGQMESRTPGPANLRHHDAMMRCLRDTAGLTIPQALHVYSLMDSYIYGFAFQQSSMAVTGATEAATGVRNITELSLPPTDDYPHLTELVVELSRSGYDFDDEFDYGLDLLLDGIERIRRQGERRDT